MNRTLPLLLTLLMLGACEEAPLPVEAPPAQTPGPETPPPQPLPPAPVPTGPVGVLAIPGGLRLVEAGGTLQLTATEDGVPTQDVTWSVRDGSVSAQGLYRAPAQAGLHLVRATSKKDPSRWVELALSVPLGTAPSGLRAALSRQAVRLEAGGTAELLLQVTDPEGSFAPDTELRATGLPEGVTATVRRVAPPVQSGARVRALADACEVVHRIPPSYLYRVWLERAQQSPPQPEDDDAPVGFIPVGSDIPLPLGLQLCHIDNGMPGCEASPAPLQGLAYDSEPRRYQSQTVFTGDRTIHASALNDLEHVALAERVGPDVFLSLWRGSEHNTVLLERESEAEQRLHGLAQGRDIAVGYVSAPEKVAMMWQVHDETPDTLAGARVERTVLGLLPGGTWSSAHAVNDGARVVGTAGTPERPLGVPFVWSGGRMLELDPLFRSLAPEARAVAIDVNSAGDVLVVASQGNACATSYLWQQGVLHTLGSPGTATWATALNDAGTVVGDTLVDGFFRAFSWKGGALTLLDLPNEESHALDVNDRGEVLATMGHEEFTEWLHIADDLARPIRFEWLAPLRLNNHGTLLGDSVLYRPAPAAQ